MLDNLNR